MKCSDTRREPSAVADDDDDDVDDNFKVPPLPTRVLSISSFALSNELFLPLKQSGTGEESRSVAQLARKESGDPLGKRRGKWTRQLTHFLPPSTARLPWFLCQFPDASARYTHAKLFNEAVKHGPAFPRLLGLHSFACQETDISLPISSLYRFTVVPKTKELPRGRSER